MLDSRETVPSRAIFHSGVVESFDHGLAKIRIYHGSDCGTCPAKGGCASAGFGETGQVITVRHGGSLAVNQRVKVALRARTDLLAVLLAFGIPIVLTVGVILGLVQCGVSQMQAALAAIGADLAYIGVLFLARGKLQEKFELVIVDQA